MYLKYNVDLENQRGVFPATGSDIVPFLSISVTAIGEFWCRKNYSTERSGMESYLLIYTISGEGRLEYRGKTFSIKPCDIMLIDCNEWQHYYTYGEKWHFRFVHFSGCAAKYLYENVTAEENFVFPVGNTVTFGGIMNQLFSFSSVTLPEEFLRCSEAVCAMFAFLMEERREKNSYKKRQSQIMAAKNYIEAHYTENLSLDKLSEEFFLSKYHFIRLFRRQTGFSPNAYLRAYRITKAQNLLKTTDLSVEEIAFRVGYDDVSAFIRAFGKSTGLTPSKFRLL